MRSRRGGQAVLRPIFGFYHQDVQNRAYLLELAALFLGADRDGGFLDNLLVAALDRAVTAKDGDCLAILIREKLDFEMARVAGELHDKNGRAGHLALDLEEERGKEVCRLDLADALPATALGGFDHDGEADADGRCEARFGVKHARLLVNVCGDVHDGAVGAGVDREAVSGPWHAGHLRRLGDDGGRDLVAECAHSRARRAEEGNAGGRERVGQLWVFRCVPPSGPDTLFVMR